MKGLILTYLIAYGGAALALFYPVVGVFTYAFLSVARPQLLYGWAGDLSGLSRVVGICLVIGWTVKRFGNWSFGRARLPITMYLCYFAWLCLSAVFADNQDVAWNTVFEQLKIVLAFLAGVTLIRSRNEVKTLAWTIVLAQALVGFEMNLSYVQGYNRAQAEGLLGDNNTFAVSLVATAGPALFLGLGSVKLWQKGIAFLSAAMILHTTLLTYSRGAVMALIVSAALSFLVMPKKPTYLLAVFLAAAIGIRLTGPQLLKRFETSFASAENRDYSAESRLKLWQDCFTVMSRNPVVGIGPDHWPLVAANFGWPRGKAAHTFWLQMGAELGIPGLFFLASFYLTTLWQGWKLARSKEDPWLTNMGCYAFSGLGGFIFAAQFVSAGGIEVPQFLAIVGLTPLLLANQPAGIIELSHRPGPPALPPQRPLRRPGRLTPEELRRVLR